MALLTERRREPVAATARVVSPYLYEVIWRIALHGPLRAEEIAEDHNRPLATPEYLYWTSQQAANRMRTLLRLGLIERDERRFYLLTPTGRTWITTGAEQ